MTNPVVLKQYWIINPTGLCKARETWPTLWLGDSNANPGSATGELSDHSTPAALRQ
jgi:hypothetical protein